MKLILIATVLELIFMYTTSIPTGIDVSSNQPSENMIEGQPANPTYSTGVPHHLRYGIHNTVTKSQILKSAGQLTKSASNKIPLLSEFTTRMSKTNEDEIHTRLSTNVIRLDAEIQTEYVKQSSDNQVSTEPAEDGIDVSGDDIKAFGDGLETPVIKASEDDIGKSDYIMEPSVDDTETSGYGLEPSEDNAEISGYNTKASGGDMEPYEVGVKTRDDDANVSTYYIESSGDTVDNGNDTNFRSSDIQRNEDKEDLYFSDDKLEDNSYNEINAGNITELHMNSTEPSHTKRKHSAISAIYPKGNNDTSTPDSTIYTKNISMNVSLNLKSNKYETPFRDKHFAHVHSQYIEPSKDDIEASGSDIAPFQDEIETSGDMVDNDDDANLNSSEQKRNEDKGDLDFSGDIDNSDSETINTTIHTTAANRMQIQTSAAKSVQPPSATKGAIGYTLDRRKDVMTSSHQSEIHNSSTTTIHTSNGGHKEINTTSNPYYDVMTSSRQSETRNSNKKTMQTSTSEHTESTTTFKYYDDDDDDDDDDDIASSHLSEKGNSRTMTIHASTGEHKQVTTTYKPSNNDMTSSRQSELRNSSTVTVQTTTGEHKEVTTTSNPHNDDITSSRQSKMRNSRTMTIHTSTDGHREVTTTTGPYDDAITTSPQTEIRNRSTVTIQSSTDGYKERTATSTPHDDGMTSSHEREMRNSSTRTIHTRTDGHKEVTTTSTPSDNDMTISHQSEMHTNRTVTVQTITGEHKEVTTTSNPYGDDMTSSYQPKMRHTSTITIQTSLSTDRHEEVTTISKPHDDVMIPVSSHQTEMRNSSAMMIHTSTDAHKEVTTTFRLYDDVMTSSKQSEISNSSTMTIQNSTDGHKNISTTSDLHDDAMTTSRQSEMRKSSTRTIQTSTRTIDTVDRLPTTGNPSSDNIEMITDERGVHETVEQRNVEDTKDIERVDDERLECKDSIAKAHIIALAVTSTAVTCVAMALVVFLVQRKKRSKKIMKSKDLPETINADNTWLSSQPNDNLDVKSKPLEILVSDNNEIVSIHSDGNIHVENEQGLNRHESQNNLALSDIQKGDSKDNAKAVLYEQHVTLRTFTGVHAAMSPIKMVLYEQENKPDNDNVKRHSNDLCKESGNATDVENDKTILPTVSPNDIETDKVGDKTDEENVHHGWEKECRSQELHCIQVINDTYQARSSEDKQHFLHVTDENKAMS